MISPSFLTAVLIVVAFFCSFLGIAGALRFRVPGATPFSFLMFAFAVYAAGSAFELSGGSLQRIVFWVKVEYVGIVLIPPLWLLFALDFTQSRVARPRLLALLFLEPALSLGLLWTTELHGLFYARCRLRPEAPFPLVAIEHGPAYWLHSAAMWLMLCSGVVILVRYAASSSQALRRSALIVLGAMFVPFATNILIIAGATPYGIDLGPFSVLLSGGLCGWAMAKRRFLDLLPVARERVLESLHEGLVILDLEGRVVDFNPAAARLFGLGPEAGGEELEEALELPELESLTAAEGEGALALPPEGRWEGGPRRLKARAFRVSDARGRRLGSSLLLTDVTETALLLDRLAELACLDGLTGALNRRRFDEVCARDFELARRAGYSVGVLMIDLDLFKKVNDERGHAAGDEVLKEVCRRCKAELRGTDAFSRYGGEEFAVFLPESDREGTVAAGERLRGAVGGSPFPWEGGGIPVTISVGAYSAVPEAEEGVDRYLRRADEALYAAKARGRDRVVFWSLP